MNTHNFNENNFIASLVKSYLKQYDLSIQELLFNKPFVCIKNEHAFIRFKSLFKLFEINNKQDKKTGYKRFKLILAEVYDKSCIINETGTKYNDNGITWIDEYVENVKDTLIGSSVTVEFADDSKTDILGHGETGQYKDGVPLLSNATAIGHFDKAYIEMFEYPRGDEAIITYTEDGHKEVVSFGNRNKALEYEIEDMEEAISKESNNMHLDYTIDVMDIMTSIRKDWGMTYPEEER